MVLKNFALPPASVSDRRTKQHDGVEMYTVEALAALKALGHSSRFSLFKLLAAHEPTGMTYPEIAAAIRGPRSALTLHLMILSNAGLVQVLPAEGAHNPVITYRARLQGVYSLMELLISDCCSHNETGCLPDDTRRDNGRVRGNDASHH